MNQDPLGDSTLSEEELRALLGDPELDSRGTAGDPGSDRAAEPAGGPPTDQPPEDAAEEFRVLISSRRRQDSAMIVERLRAHSFAVDSVGNPFRLLDCVREERYDTIVSDMELWADSGGLLVDRLSRLETPPLLVFLAPRNQPRPELLRQGVAGILLCPLDASSTEMAVGQMRRALRASRLPARLDYSEPVPSGGADLAQRSENVAAELVDSSVGDTGLVRSGLPHPLEMGESRTDAGEVAWLRFFLEVQRLVFQRPQAETLYQSFVELGCEVLGAQAASIVYSRGEQQRVFLVGASADAVARLSGQLGPRSPGRAKIGDWEVEHTVGAEHCRLVFHGLPKHVWCALDEFEDDLKRLLVRGGS